MRSNAIRLASAIGFLGLALCVPAPAAVAATITVNTLSDSSTSGDHLCSLREAVNNANAATDTTSGDCTAGSGVDTVVFNISGTITLNSTLPTVANGPGGSLTIDGTGQNVTIDGADSYLVMRVNAGASLGLNGVTIAHGSFFFAGGILSSGTLTVTNSTVSGNVAFEAAAIFSEGTLTISHSTVSGNLGGTSGDGGGVTNNGIATITDSTFSNNTTGRNGGAIINGGTMTITRSTLSGNTAFNNGEGGAIFNTGGLTISNSTFTGNVSTNAGVLSDGGAITNNGGSLTVSNSTISGNNATTGGGINNYPGGQINLSNTILSSNSAGNCAGIVINSGYDISDDASCGFGNGTGANGQQIGDNVNPSLDPNGLQNNGGPTQTIALQSASSAIDAIPLVDCPSTDQRGVPRPDAGEAACDIGAYEFVHFTGVPGTKGCTGKSTSVLAQTYGGLDAAASALLYPDAKALQTAVQTFCGG